MERTEQELIERRQAIFELLDRNEIKVITCSDHEKQTIKAEDIELKYELLQIDQKLKTVPSETTQQIHQALIGLMNDLNIAINQERDEYSLSLNQGTVIPDYLFGKIMGGIKDVFEHGYKFYSKPDLYYSNDEDFDSSSLQHLLLVLKEKLIKARFENYFELKDFVENMLDQIKDLEN
jgi:hypothetical protein